MALMLMILQLPSLPNHVPIYSRVDWNKRSKEPCSRVQHGSAGDGSRTHDLSDPLSDTLTTTTPRLSFTKSARNPDHFLQDERSQYLNNIYHL